MDKLGDEFNLGQDSIFRDRKEKDASRTWRERGNAILHELIGGIKYLNTLYNTSLVTPFAAGSS